MSSGLSSLTYSLSPINFISCLCVASVDPKYLSRITPELLHSTPGPSPEHSKCFPTEWSWISLSRNLQLPLYLPVLLIFYGPTISAAIHAIAPFHSSCTVLLTSLKSALPSVLPTMFGYPFPTITTALLEVSLFSKFPFKFLTYGTF